MKSFLFPTIFLAVSCMACTNDTDNNTNDMPAYTVGQKCPEQITYNGICDHNKVVFCNKNGVIEENVCKSTCMIKEAYIEPFAECYYECGNIDYKGICTEDGLDYCDKTEGLIHFTCEAGKTCGLKNDLYSCI